MDCGNHVNTITSWIAVKQTVTTSPNKRYKKEDVIAIFYRKKTFIYSADKTSDNQNNQFQ